MAGRLTQAKNCLHQFSKIVYSTRHCLPRPPDTAGLPSSLVWEASQSFRAGGVLGGPGRQVSTLPGNRST
eukprot:246879-Pelagomonas_calceolata.AAC.3